VEADPKSQLCGKRRAIMAETDIYSGHKNGHTGAMTRAGTARPHRRGKIDFLLALSIGSIAFGILLLALIAVYLFQGLSAGMLAIWICCGVVVPALMVLGSALFWFTRGRPREAALASGQRHQEIQARVDQNCRELIEKPKQP
jgi:hypothetical protein